MVSDIKSNVYVKPVVASVKLHNGLAEPPGHENECQVAVSPEVPAKAPVSAPPTNAGLVGDPAGAGQCGIWGLGIAKGMRPIWKRECSSWA
jgi:hypothetical protein